MSDPPPKKVGSLRDRIAAFENKGTSGPPPVPAPLPRPKPGHVTWTPKPASPPTSPRRADTEEAASAHAGMSASDAKESIGKLSLKERMAALQGSTAFGGPAAGGPPPRPMGEKPKWKPPPVVQRVAPVGGEDPDEPAKPPSMPVLVPAAPDSEGARSPGSADEEKKEETKEEAGEELMEEGEPDPQEEERQRRAALAARMAKLGGARVGMGPPIFGKKPDIPPKKVVKEEPKPAEETPKNDDQVAEVASKDESARPEVSITSEDGK